MGYYKNEDIADELYVPRRIPRPKPATEHVAVTRRALRIHQKSTPVWVPLAFGGLFLFAGGFTLGVMF